MRGRRGCWGKEEGTLADGGPKREGRGRFGGGGELLEGNMRGPPPYNPSPPRSWSMGTLEEGE